MAITGAERKVEVLTQTLIRYAREIAEGNVEQLDLELLQACLALLKQIKNQSEQQKSPKIEVKHQPAPMPPPPPPPAVTPKAPPATPVRSVAVSPSSTSSHHQALSDALAAIKDALPETSSEQFTPMLQSRLAGIESAESKRRNFLAQRAQERRNPDECGEFSLQLLKDVVECRKNLQNVSQKTPIQLALERDERLARNEERSAISLQRYNERLALKEKQALAKEIDEMILSFIMVPLDTPEQNHKTNPRRQS
ncbi:MAG: hypothetical protein AB7I18_01525 [Candidatus Berkiella sp.]